MYLVVDANDCTAASSGKEYTVLTLLNEKS